MAHRRVKNIDYDEEEHGYYDEYYDYEDYGGDGDYWDADGGNWSYQGQPKSKPKSKAKAVKGKAGRHSTKTVDATKNHHAPLNETPTATAAAASTGPAERMKSHDEVVEEVQGRVKDVGLLPKGRVQQLVRQSSRSLSRAEELVKQDVEEMKSNKEEMMTQALHIPKMCLVVVGHVDSGKSTLMGHLLVELGNISSREMHRFTRDAAACGKQSFEYAWVLDEGSDERARGVTIDVCVKHFTTPKGTRVTLLDAPGHKDFVPNMLLGAVQADFAIVLADVKDFDKGFTRGGQTKEHIRLLRALGINKIIVAINKMDLVDYSQDPYNRVRDELETFIGGECGFKSHNVSYIPTAGFVGENLVTRENPKLMSWWQGDTLVTAIDKLAESASTDSAVATKASLSAPLRIAVADVYKSSSGAQISGRVEQGTFKSGQKIVVLPGRGDDSSVCTIRNVYRNGEDVQMSVNAEGYPGDYIDLATLQGVDPYMVIRGSVLCAAAANSTACQVSTVIRAKIVVFDTSVPIVKGQQVMLYAHACVESATVTRFVRLEGKKAPPPGVRAKPIKCLTKGDCCTVELTLQHPICTDPIGHKGSLAKATSLSRVVLRDRGETVAAGLIV